ncbi:heterokaryon incompatibility protein-domain-containing protein [Podospora conica]|nr:heterokaryon incompatibility protein-domain-containing protein [Schizothecium conicum]
MAPALYQHQPLSDTHSIRLLHIRHEESEPHKLSLSLREVDLDTNPEFCALSYTWKSPVYTVTAETAEAQFDVHCDGKTTTISENLFHFLQTVRSIVQRPRFLSNQAAAKSSKPNLDHLLSSLPIWIDALCIDQTNPSERQHQVLLMHKIYSRAKHVVVWLSSSELDPRGSVIWVHNTFIPAVARLMAADPHFVATRLAADPLCESRAVVERLGGPICSHWAGSWLGFANFLDRHRWFDRGWVVQEVALGRPGNISLLCGATELSWVRLSAFSRFLHQTGWAQSLRNTLNSRITKGVRMADGTWWSRSGNRRPIGWKIRSIEDIRWLVDAGQREKGVVLGGGDAMRFWFLKASSLVAILRLSEFEDHKDHVYGSLGMLSQLLPEGVQSPITPDYEMTTEEVFTSVATTFITGTQSLLELSQVEDRRRRRYHQLPSWVPDYSVNPGDSILRSMSGSDAYYKTLLDSSELTNPSAGKPIIPPPIIEGSKLIAHGIRIDTRGEATLQSFSDTVQFRDNLLNVLLSATTLHTTTMASDFFTALALGQIPFYRTPDHPSLDRTTSSRLASDTEPSSTFAPLRNARPSAPGIPALDRYGVPASFLDSEDWLASTSQAIPLGLGPGSCLKGDEVWVLAGAGTPVLLRRVRREGEQEVEGGREYMLVGKVYIPGVDMGRVLREAETGQVKAAVLV